VRPHLKRSDLFLIRHLTGGANLLAGAQQVRFKAERQEKLR